MNELFEKIDNENTIAVIILSIIVFLCVIAVREVLKRLKNCDE